MIWNAVSLSVYCYIGARSRIRISLSFPFCAACNREQTAVIFLLSCCCKREERERTAKTSECLFFLPQPRLAHTHRHSPAHGHERIILISLLMRAEREKSSSLHHHLVLGASQRLSPSNSSLGTGAADMPPRSRTTLAPHRPLHHFPACIDRRLLSRKSRPTLTKHDIDRLCIEPKVKVILRAF